MRLKLKLKNNYSVCSILFISLIFIFSNFYDKASCQKLQKLAPILDSLDNYALPKPIVGRFDLVYVSRNQNQIFTLAPWQGNKVVSKQFLAGFPDYFNGNWAGKLKLISKYPLTFNQNQIVSDQFIQDNLFVKDSVYASFIFQYNNKRKLQLAPPQILIKLNLLNKQHLSQDLKSQSYANVIMSNNLEPVTIGKNTIKKKAIRNYVLNLGNKQFEYDFLLQSDNQYNETLVKFSVLSNDISNATIILLTYDNQFKVTQEYIFSGKIYRGCKASFDGLLNFKINSGLESDSQPPIKKDDVDDEE